MIDFNLFSWAPECTVSRELAMELIRNGSAGWCLKSPWRDSWSGRFSASREGCIRAEKLFTEKYPWPRYWEMPGLENLSADDRLRVFVPLEHVRVREQYERFMDNLSFRFLGVS